jgi:hypothetical protein
MIRRHSITGQISVESTTLRRTRLSRVRICAAGGQQWPSLTPINIPFLKNATTQL